MTTRTASNVRLAGRCYDGQVMSGGEWTDPHTGKRHWGATYSTCEECGGKGCAKSGQADLDEATADLSDKQLHQIAKVVREIVNQD